MRAGWEASAGAMVASGFVPSTRGELADGTCTRLVCAHRWTAEGSAVSELIASRRKRLARARTTGLRTALLSASGWLVRWYEGTEDAVEEEWQRLQDGPHGPDLRTLLRSVGQPALHQPVQIASLHSGDAVADVSRRVANVVREQRQGWIAEPAELWQALAAPCRLPYPHTAGVLPPRELLALASEENEAVETVRVLAHASAQPLAYQRYAGADLERRDVGAAYVDLPAAPGVTIRVHALPRRALQGGMAMLGVGNVRCVVVLLDQQGSRADSLLADVGRMLHQLPVRPLVVLGGREGLPHADAVAALGPLGGQPVSLEVAGPSREAAALVWDLVKAAGTAGQWSAAQR